MKHIGKIVVAFILVFMLFACAGCSGLLSSMEDEALRADTETMIKAILENDFDAGYALVEDITTEDNFLPSFTSLRELLGEADSYELKLLSVYRNRSVNNGKTVDSVRASYKLTVNSNLYVIDVAMDSTDKNLSYFYATPYEKTNYFSTGEIGTMSGANAFQWIMLFSNLISVALIVFALVDACRSKIKLKALWIAIIVLGIVTLGVTIAATRLNFNFNISWLFAYSALILYGGGTAVFRVMLPVGAIVYFILRKKLLKKALPEDDTAPVEEEKMPEQAISHDASDTE